MQDSVGCWQVVGWGDQVEELAAGLAEFAVDGTVVTVISPDRPRGLPEEPLRGCTFRHVEGSPTSFQSFHQAGLAECDSLLLGMPWNLCYDLKLAPQTDDAVMFLRAVCG